MKGERERERERERESVNEDLLKLIGFAEQFSSSATPRQDGYVTYSLRLLMSAS